MNNKLDKLFKDKLEGDSIQPSAQAWEKVEAHLGKKNRMVLWLRVAAAIALLVAVSFVVLNWNKDYEAPAKEFAKDEKKVEEQAPQPEQAEVKQPVAENNRVRSQEEGVRRQEVAKTESFKREANVVDTTNSKLEIQNSKSEQLAVIEETLTPNTDPQTLNTEPTIKKGITLTYSLPPVKKQAEPMVAEVKKKGLERVLEIAKEVKNRDSPLADLREAKDDIFALDFKKEKKKTNQGF